MNKHVNKNKTKKPAPINRQQARHDCMPKEVATEMLCNPKVRSNNRERKVWHDARSVIWEGTLSPKPYESRTAKRLTSAFWTQLAKWGLRCEARRMGLQRMHQLYVRLIVKLKDQISTADAAKKAVLEAGIARLDLLISNIDIQVAGLDAFADAIETEIERRKGFIAEIANAGAPGIAKILAGQLVGQP